MTKKELGKLKREVPKLLAKYGILPSTDRMYQYAGPSRWGCPLMVTPYLEHEPWLACRFDRPCEKPWRPGLNAFADIPHTNPYSGKSNCHTFGLVLASEVLDRFEYHLIERCPAIDTPNG